MIIFLYSLALHTLLVYGLNQSLATIAYEAEEANLSWVYPIFLMGCL